MPGLVAALPERGVDLDGPALRLVEGGDPRCRAHGRGYECRAACEVGAFDRPLQTLETADRTADEQLDMLDAEPFGQHAVAAYHVAHGDLREVAVPLLAGGGVDAERTGRAVVRAEEVGADDEIFRRVEELALFDRMFPPFGHFGVCGQGVAYPDDVVAGGRQLPVCRVCHRHFGQHAAAFELQRTVEMFVPYHAVTSRMPRRRPVRSRRLCPRRSRVRPICAAASGLCPWRACLRR